MVKGLVSPYPKAGLFRRFCAATVDGLVVTTGLLIGARPGELGCARLRICPHLAYGIRREVTLFAGTDWPRETGL
jgi:hypothetical protein